jgi:hypothetical protein
MTLWLSDFAAGLGLLVFIGSVFLLASAAPAIIGLP